MKTLRYVWLVFFVTSIQLVIAQDKIHEINSKEQLTIGLRNEAEKEYNALRYEYAIPFYQSYLNKINFYDTVALLHLAESYQLTKSYDSALQTYKKVVLSDKMCYGKLAELYANRGNYIEAIKAYTTLLSLVTDTNRKKLIVERINGFSNLHKMLRDSLNWQLNYLKLNTAANEFSPVCYEDGVIFVSNRLTPSLFQNISGWDGNSYFRLFYINDSLAELTASAPTERTVRKYKIKKTNIDLTPETSNDNNAILKRIVPTNNKKAIKGVRLFDDFFNRRYNAGPISFTADGQTAFYTQNERNRKGISRLNIKAAKKINGKWHEIPTAVHSDKGYSSYHPAINKNGTQLYFVSDRKGGFGGADLYFVNKINDSLWSSAINAGPAINSAGNELFPVINGDTLYFSSDGHSGLGGLDIYGISLKDPNAKIFNLGYPVNSSYDDFGWTTKENTLSGYLSSNRLGSDDIYSFTKTVLKYRLNGIVSYKSDNTKAAIRKLILFDLDDNKIADSTLTDDNGNYSFEINPNRNYQLWPNEAIGTGDPIVLNTASSHKDIKEDILLLGSSKKQMEDSLRDYALTIQLQSIQKKQDSILKLNKPTLFTIYYGLNKANLTEGDRVILDSIIILMNINPELNAVLGSFTDCLGSASYNLELSAKRSKAVMTYLLINGIPQRRIIENHYGKAYLISDCLAKNYSVSEQWLNRRTEIYLTNTKGRKWVDLHEDNSIKTNKFLTLQFKSEKKLPKTNYSQVNVKVIPANRNRDRFDKINDSTIQTGVRHSFGKTISKVVGKKDSVELKMIAKPVDNNAGQNSKPVLPENKNKISKNSKDQQLEDNITKQEIVTALDSLAKLKEQQERIVQYLTKRINKKPIEIFTKADSVSVELYDSGIHDDDSVSVIYNNHLVVDRKELRVDKPIRFELKVNKETKYNELVLVAENLGKEPPNTAVMIITDKYNKRQEVYLNTDLSHNEVIYFIKIVKN